MITEEKRACFVDEWIEVSSSRNNSFYKSLGYKKYRNKKEKLVFKIHPWELLNGSHLKVRIKCFGCSEIRLIQFYTFYNAKTSLCVKCASSIQGKKNKKDLTGQQFGRLLVIKDSGYRTKDLHILWYCKCACGNFVKISSNSLIMEKTKSCGCLQKEKAKLSITEFHRKCNHFVKLEHTKEEIDQYLEENSRNGDTRWNKLSKELRKNAKCLVCGAEENLVVHHMNNYKEYSEQRYDKDNLVILCKSCHMKYHHFSIDETKENFELWILNNYKTNV